MEREREREYLRGARRKARAAKDYFDDDDDDDGSRGSMDSSSHSSAVANGRQQQQAMASSAGGGDDDEVDPLDAFMMGIETQVVQERAQTHKTFVKPDVLNHGDDADAYMAEYARATGQAGADDSDDEVYAAAKRADHDDALDDADSKRTVEVLAPVDHTRITYEPFRKCLYTPHADVAAMSAQDVAALRRELGVRVDGSDVPHPVRSFMHLGLDRPLLAALLALGLEAPTAIQAQAVPVALAGRDIIGLAQTGSGKTLAFALPMVRHVLQQRAAGRWQRHHHRSGNNTDGPIALVLSPTRELAHQIFVQTRKLLRGYNGDSSVECAAIYGGVGKWEQIQALRRGAEVVVATPGRLIELLRKRAATLTRVTFVVLDEADRMFEMGFEPQLRSVLGQIRPDRQTLLFSATFRRRIEALARDILTDPVKVLVGHVGQANDDIRQLAVVLPHDSAKWPWLLAHIDRIAADGRTLVFASSKLGCETLATNLSARGGGSGSGIAARSLHGDKTQHERSEALAAFRSGACRVLVATDVAARGLDIKDVKTVVNFDVAKSIDLHVHRIGRTGRMGVNGFEPGTAYTLVTAKESHFAAQLVHNMDVSGQPVAPDLLALASRDPRFRRGSGSGMMAMAAKGSMGGSGAPSRERGDQNASASAQNANAGADDDDADEMERWHESRRTSRADQRKGLGFAGPASGLQGRGGHGRGSFRVTSSAAALSSSFQSAFVKSTSGGAAASTPAHAPTQAPAPEACTHPPSPTTPSAPQQVVSAWTAPVPPPPPQIYQAQSTVSMAPAAVPPPPSSVLPRQYGVAPASEPQGAAPTAAASAASTNTGVAMPPHATGALAHSATQDSTRDDTSRSRLRAARSRSRSNSSSSSSRSPRQRSSSSRRRCSRSPSRSRSRGRRRRRRSPSSSRSRSRSRSRGRGRRRQSRSSSRSRSKSRSRSRSRTWKRRRRYSRSHSSDRRSRQY